MERELKSSSYVSINTFLHLSIIFASSSTSTSTSTSSSLFISSSRVIDFSSGALWSCFPTASTLFLYESVIIFPSSFPSETILMTFEIEDPFAHFDFEWNAERDRADKWA